MADTDGDRVSENVALGTPVLEAVNDAEELPVAVVNPDSEGIELLVSVGDRVGRGELEADADSDALPHAVAESVAVTDAVGVADERAEADEIDDPVRVPVSLGDALKDAVADGDAVAVTERSDVCFE